MKMKLITQFQLKWNPHSKTGKIKLKLEKGEKKLRFDEASEFNAVALILLNDKSVHLLEDGTIFSGVE